MKKRIFYSWTAELPNPTNRGFIESALEKAAKRMSAADDPIEFEIDSDTRGEPGSPDIANTIFSKIAKADVFVADVSIANVDAKSGRKMPNANVLIELGYAAGLLGWDKIVLVFNKAFGDAKADLPFDLGYKRAKIYLMTEECTDRAPERSRLSGVLEGSIREIVTIEENAGTGEWLGELGSTLFPILTAIDEFEERMGHWDGLRYEFEGWGNELRSLSKTAPPSLHETLAGALQELSEHCDDVATALRHSGHGLEEPFAKLKSLSTEIKEQTFDAVPLSEESQSAVAASIRETAEECEELGQRAEKLIMTGRSDDVVEAASRLGGRLLQWVYYDLQFLGDAAAPLRTTARSLHLLDSTTFYMDGGATLRRVVAEIQEASKTLLSISGRL